MLLALLAARPWPIAQAARGSVPAPIARRGARGCMAAFALLWLQIALGGWVSTNYAVLACSDFPTCQGSWWPAMDFAQGFELWRELGRRAHGEHIALRGADRDPLCPPLLAYVVLRGAGRGWPGGCARRPAAHRRRAGSPAWSLWQFATGLSNVVLGWPLVAAVAHTGGAAALVVVLTWALVRERKRGGRPCRQPGSGRGSSRHERGQDPTALGQPARVQAAQQFYALTKPRVVQLIVFCALIGMVLAVPGVPTLADLRLALIACLGIWLVAGAAAAFNCLVEQGIDAKMARTAWRATAKGELSDWQTLLFSAVLCAAGLVAAVCRGSTR